MKIEFIGIQTKIITTNDRDIVQFVKNALRENECELKDNDFVIIASKIISTAEGCQYKISDIKDIRQETY